MSYRRPVDAPISASWQDHRNRNPPSSEPGTDYACAYGTILLASYSGVVADVSHSTAGGTGRYIAVDLDDGRRTRSLHLAEIWVSEGQRVDQGQHLGLTGASGFGSNYGYGPHVHQTLFPRHAYNFDDTLDFELYVGSDNDLPPEEGFWMALSDSDQEDLYAKVKFITDQVEGKIATDRPATGQLAEYLRYGGYPMSADIKRSLQGWEAADGTRWAVSQLLENPRAYVEAHDTAPDTAGGLKGPAWAIGFFLGLIGLVEVVRLVVDLIT